jgi:hypothetical protein
MIFRYDAEHLIIHIIGAKDKEDCGLNATPYDEAKVQRFVEDNPVAKLGAVHYWPTLLDFENNTTIPKGEVI